MHGHIHNCLHIMIMKNYGDTTWRKLMYKTGSDLSHFMKLRVYDDAMTMKLLETAAQIIGVGVDEFILSFGQNFLKYIMDLGYLKLLQSLGPTFHEFAENLDAIHSLLSVVYDDIISPQFRCERFPDNTLLLHYYTTRPKIAWMIGGMMLTAADTIYKVKLAFCLERIGTYTDEPTPLSHTAMVIRVREEWATEHHPMDDLMRQLKSEMGITDISNVPEKATTLAVLNGNAPSEDLPGLSTASLCNTFPYHIIFDNKLNIKQAGARLRKLYPQVCVGTPLTDSCKIKYPNIPLNFTALRQFAKASFIVEVIRRRAQKALFLKGQMLPMGESHVLFICSPDVETITALLDRKIFLSDLPVFDATRQFLLLNQLRIADLGKSKDTEETAATLQRLRAELEAERNRSDTMLKETLPERIVEELRESNRAPAETYELATILIAEVVNLDNHAQKMTPVDIVEILNNLAMNFELMIKRHKIFKVDTSSEIHMMVGGIPDPDLDHAKKIGVLAIEMLEQAKSIIPQGKSQKETPQIRIGIHSGSVVAGVVGERMPRYCLFGSTVTIASQMMELAPPGKIQTSQEGKRYLTEAGFQMEERGTMKVKGRGKVPTYFLIAASTGGGNAISGSALLEGKIPKSSVCLVL